MKEYTLKQSDASRFKLDFGGRSRVKVSPCCNRNNRDGKFVPLVGEDAFGYCYSCNKYILPGEICPRCHRPTFLPYIEKHTGSEVGEGVGYCTECKYNYTPSQFYADNRTGNIHQMESSVQITPKQTPEPVPDLPPSYIPEDVVSASLRGYKQNNFVRWLDTLFTPETVLKLVTAYKIGTSKYYTSGTVFFQTDMEGNVRSGKILQYNPVTGKRNRDLPPTWVHKVMKMEGFNLKQCLFGEHLLPARPGVPVALCEAEKTAVVCSEYFPSLVWVATGGKTQLTPNKLKILNGRTVVMFPDGDGFDEWTHKAEQLNKAFPTSRFYVSDIIQTVCEAGGTSSDLCDFVTQFPVTSFTGDDAPSVERTLSSVGERSTSTDTVPVVQTVGEVFDLFTSNGYTKFPSNIRVNSPYFKAKK